MKKIVGILLLSILLTSFTGCSYGSPQTHTGQAVSVSTNIETVVLERKAAMTDENKAASNTIEEIAVKNSSDKDKGEAKARETKPLDGLTVCIDPGHGILAKKVKKTEPLAPGSKVMKAATASGTTGVVTKVTEESLNLTVSLKLKKALADKGANVIMVRETHTCNMTNVERTDFWNKSGADLTIRIHANGSESKKASGVLMMVPGDKYIKDKDMLLKSEKAGEYIMEGVLKNTKAKSAGTVKSTDLTGFNWSKIPVMLLEMGFMTNPEEDRLLNSDSYQNKIVTGITEGVEKYNSYINSGKKK